MFRIGFGNTLRSRIFLEERLNVRLGIDSSGFVEEYAGDQNAELNYISSRS